MHRERFSAQLLSGERVGSAPAVVEQLLAVQAQDPRGMRLAIRARTVPGVRAADVDRALAERELVVDWLCRGTLHLVGAADHAWLHALTATSTLRVSNARRLAQEGVSPDQAQRGVRCVAKALADGPLSRAQLRGVLESAGVPVAGQAFVHILFLASLEGLIVRGPDLAFVLSHDWLGERRVPDLDAALAELARRYLRGHGPATAADLAKWAGLPLGQARAGLRAIAPEELGDGLVDLPDARRSREVPAPILLGPFDPLLLGWVSREAIVGKHRSIVTSNGLFRAFALVGGRAVATWSLRGSELTVTALEKISANTLRALRADTTDVVDFLGL